MRNPCPTCESALLDKNKCSLGCERRHEYCKHLGISITGLIQPKKLLEEPFDRHAPRRMYHKGGRLEKATAAIKKGLGNRETSRLTGMANNTVAKLRKVLEEQNGGPFLCACGLTATHGGVCAQRFERFVNNSVSF